MIPAFIAEGRCQTRSGYPVIIHTTSGPDGKFCVIGSAKFNGGWAIKAWQADGRYDHDRPHDMDLVEPPSAEAGPREWDLGFHISTEEIAEWHGLYHPSAENNGWTKIRVVELRPGWKLVREVEDVEEVPEGVPPVPEGFAYVGKGPLLGAEELVREEDLICCQNGSWQSWPCNGHSVMHYAARIGSEAWKRNRPPEQPGSDGFRYFTKNGYQWRFPKGAPSSDWARTKVDGEWILSGFLIGSILQKGFAVETTATGEPLEGRAG